jgi:tetratricopeptide (TPR) repeat protein
MNPDLEAFIEVLQREGWTFIEAGETEADFQRPASRISPWLAFLLPGLLLSLFDLLRGRFRAVEHMHIQVTADGDLIRKQELIRLSDHNRAIELNPGDAGGYCRRGVSLVVLGKHDEAIADYDEAVQLDPTYADAYYRRGVAHAQTGAIEQAIADLEQALTVSTDPDDRTEIEELMEDIRRSATD